MRGKINSGSNTPIFSWIPSSNQQVGQAPQTGIEKVLWQSSGMAAVLGLVPCSCASEPSVKPSRKIELFKVSTPRSTGKFRKRFSLTGENYKEAIRLLTDRYGNKQVLISAHMEGLLKLPAATSINETKKLRDIYDKLESHVRSLYNIGITSET